MNGQIIVYAKVVLHPKYFPVVLGLNIVARAQVLGNMGPDDPVCVYKDKNGTQYLSGTDVTSIFLLFMKVVMPNISDSELKLI